MFSIRTIGIVLLCLLAGSTGFVGRAVTLAMFDSETVSGTFDTAELFSEPIDDDLALEGFEDNHADGSKTELQEADDPKDSESASGLDPTYFTRQ